MGAFAICATLQVLSIVHHVHEVHAYKVQGIVRSDCDLYQGSWVKDDSYPLYNTSNCNFIEREFDCQNNGRPDKEYLKYRWQPTGCKLPRFNGQDFLSRLQGKSIMFVGDSLSLNQWQSLTCMLHISDPQTNKYTLVRTGGLSTFTFLVYNTKIMFQRNAFLVDIVTTNIGRVLKPDSIESGKSWVGIDFLIFDTWHWWLHTGKKQPWDFIEEGNATIKDMERLVVYEKALNTWAKWVNTNVDAAKTMVFFQGVSPDHYDGSDWGEQNSMHCEGQREPFLGANYPAGPHPAELVVEKVSQTITKPLYLLNVTYLSQIRKDGHPSVYGHGGHRDMDCSHWCLPGVPDTWNQLLQGDMGAFGVITSLLLIASMQQVYKGHSKIHEEKGHCDLYKGTWEYDKSYPLYNSTQCPFIEKEFDCQKNGRPDQFYLHFRWQPTSCNLPSFNGGDFLRRYRGKRLMFIGDSLSLNQFQSLTCMLHVAVPNTKYISQRTGDLSTFNFPEYNVSLMLSRNAFLVDIVHEKMGRVLEINSIGSGDLWKGFDTLIFDSWHWWTHSGRKQPWDFVRDNKEIYKDADRLVLYEKALSAWANWVDSNVNPTKTKVFFQGVSPDHWNSSDLDPESKTCIGQRLPMVKYTGGPPPAEVVLEKVIRRMSKPVQLLNITTLSQLRKDGHPSVYGLGGHRGDDCTHWCLPGVPDIWNQLLYANLF
ncbi:PC-Esterase domain-containing protein/PMR5N domain-containing protein [Cephalotus follicularis]|uniref:PC-Esterase domain-containing protein/PMR5N domain-containing protein n=1 Tax=Cephalotus follicularis TaxID=3775 RepID=A0A1Q3AZT5_CEPFO|nr:PC-Esterase domain-containing protein/PMR5N domain-containing protein [Cephalotus follicularis]